MEILSVTVTINNIDSYIDIPNVMRYLYVDVMVGGATANSRQYNLIQISILI